MLGSGFLDADSVAGVVLSAAASSGSLATGLAGDAGGAGSAGSAGAGATAAGTLATVGVVPGEGAAGSVMTLGAAGTAGLVAAVAGALGAAAGTGAVGLTAAGSGPGFFAAEGEVAGVLLPPPLGLEPPGRRPIAAVGPPAVGGGTAADGVDAVGSAAGLLVTRAYQSPNSSPTTIAPPIATVGPA